MLSIFLLFITFNENLSINLLIFNILLNIITLFPKSLIDS
ncbi:hypothetical protein SAMN05216261_2481 [Algibacter luteus]|uniref:Uncharacterized protein n=1 Tax=Algibacter luteus TaxID=1178825 RepID=A0A1M6FTV1_9FLAO|nr:hypothetical protein SAMN05216261_2481 [Algibacter luteus]